MHACVDACVRHMLTACLRVCAMQLGDREKFEQFDRKEPRRAQSLKAQARKDRKGLHPDQLSRQTLFLVILGFVVFLASAAYLIVANLLPPPSPPPS